MAVVPYERDDPLLTYKMASSRMFCEMGKGDASGVYCNVYTCFLGEAFEADDGTKKWFETIVELPETPNTVFGRSETYAVHVRACEVHLAMSEAEGAQTLLNAEEEAKKQYTMYPQLIEMPPLEPF